MNTRINKTVLLITLMICLATAVYSAVGTFTFRTSGASDTTEVVDLRYPQKVPEDASVTTDSIADGSVTPTKISSGYNLLSDAEKTQALVGSTTVPFNASTINGVVPLTAIERAQALVGSTTAPFDANEVGVTSGFLTFKTSGRGIRTSTVDGADNFYMSISASNAPGATRGGYMFFYGNDYGDTSSGDVKIFAGDAGPYGKIEFYASGSLRLTIKKTGIINIANAPTYADNAAATTGGLAAGDVYKTSAGALMIRY